MNSFNFKSYFNFLSRNKGYTAINLIGFSVALMFVVLLGLYVSQELRADQFHRDKERIYQMTSPFNDAFAWKIADDLKNRYPDDIETFTRLMQDGATITHGTEHVLTNTLYVDSTFFNIFSFPILDGSPDRLFEVKTDAVVTETFARRLFGDQPAVGQTIRIDTVTYLISGVAADFRDSHIANPDLLLRADNVNPWLQEDYNNAGAVLIYLKTNPGVDFHSKLPAIVEWFKEFYWPYKDSGREELGLRPITESYFAPPKIYPNGTIANNKIFILILLAAAAAILCFAITNYINLSVAQSGFRAKEAATRRLLGGTRTGLFMSYILESVLFCAGAFVLALLLAGTVEPFFNRVMQSDVSVKDMLAPATIALGVGGIILLGFISGFFPALILSRYKPIEVVRGEFTRKTRMVYSRVFICFQYAITIVLLGCALTIMRQTRFMRTTDLGFEKENIIVMKNTLERSRTPGLRDRLMQIPGVRAVSFTMGTPLNGGNNNTVNYDDGTTISFQVLEVDTAFWGVMQIEKIRQTNIGRKGFWLNEEAVRVLQLPDTATEFRMNNPEAIAGVVRDFHFRKLDQPIGPMVIREYSPEGNKWPWDILVKINSATPGETYRQVREAYLDYNGGMPFESSFADVEVDSWYDEQEKTATIIGWFSLIAILISALGLLAMATYFMRQRSRDIAVRKVFGATGGEVLNRLVLSFLKIVLVSFVLAVPVIWYMMARWLQTFAYRIPLHWTIFAFSGLVAGAIAFGAVFWQSWRAANANPVKTLYKG